MIAVGLCVPWTQASGAGIGATRLRDADLPIGERVIPTRCAWLGSYLAIGLRKK